MNFRFYWNSLIFLNLGICCQIKICPGLFVLFISLGIIVEIVLNKNVFIDFRIHRNTLIKILYLKGYRWLFSQNQWVRIGLLDYRRYEALAKHVKPFLKKTLKWKDVSAPTTPSEDITTIIKSLNPNKATGRDLIILLRGILQGWWIRILRWTNTRKVLKQLQYSSANLEKKDRDKIKKLQQTC